MSVVLRCSLAGSGSSRSRQACLSSYDDDDVDDGGN